VSSTGLDLAPDEYDEHVVEEHVEHSTALHSRLRDGTRYLVGPLARYALNRDRLSPVAREAADAAGLEAVCRNPFRSIVVRAVEILYALDEALRLIAAYEPPDPAGVEVPPRAGVGHGWTEAPRGMLWHRYEIDGDGTILDARIVPPTSQNQGRIEQSLHGFVQQHVELDDDELRLRCEQAVRSYDPCISCATHFLRLEIDRG
jgi:coenzyme F420-reducing hydrogenase alpha subunit